MQGQTTRGRKLAAVLLFVLTTGALTMLQVVPSIAAQGQAAAPAAAPAGPVNLQIVDGSTATYRVQEQLAGVNFPNTAEGTTPGVTGTIALNSDGSVNSAQSKLTIDLKGLKSDQDMRDGYIQKRTLETDKFPVAEFVPKTLKDVASPFPTTGQTGFELTGDLTIHGTTKEVTWQGIATFGRDGVIAGRCMTDLTFAQFGLMKPTLARLLSVDDKIHLEIAFRFKKS
jgi:polyisoprenoid-binding protein YceI